MALSLLIATAALGWDAAGHRTVTLLAMDGFARLAPDRPTFLAREDVREQAAYQSTLPDRYRALRSIDLRHENEPEHYIDVEDLEGFGLTLETVPRLRYEYMRVMAVAKHVHPEEAPEYDAKGDRARSKEFPGLVLHAIMEHQAKLTSCMRTLRTLEALNDPNRQAEVAAEKANVIAEMAQLSHFVADLAQPLHTTRHHHGWNGPNPMGYTTDKKFHSFIDGDVLAHHKLDYKSLAGTVEFDRKIERKKLWESVLSHAQRSHEKVEPLYLLEKTGDLKKEDGKKFISERLGDGARTLAALYAAAWKASALPERAVEKFLEHEGASDMQADTDGKPDADEKDDQ